MDQAGNLYVADTWNQRIQVFAPDNNGVAQVVLQQWDVEGWHVQSLDNKPYLDVGPQGSVYVSDPELSRVVVFSPDGKVLATWGTQGPDGTNLNYPTGVALADDGGVWVSDTKNNRVQFFLNPLSQE
mgnify:CR=1 FL=1